MKLRLLISFLFIIATTATAIHELEHISHEHDSSTCLICAVDNHTLSADVVDTFVEIEIVKYSKISSAFLVKPREIKDHSYQTRAPPLYS